MQVGLVMERRGAEGKGRGWARSVPRTCGRYLGADTTQLPCVTQVPSWASSPSDFGSFLARKTCAFALRVPACTVRQCQRVVPPVMFGFHGYGRLAEVYRVKLEVRGVSCVGLGKWGRRCGASIAGILDRNWGDAGSGVTANLASSKGQGFYQRSPIVKYS